MQKLANELKTLVVCYMCGRSLVERFPIEVMREVCLNNSRRDSDADCYCIDDHCVRRRRRSWMRSRE